MERGQMLTDYQKYEGHYFDVSQQITNQPNEVRRCTDGGCVVVFVIIIVAFFAIGSYQLNEYNNHYKTFQTSQANSDGLYINRHLPIIGVGIGASILVSYLYVFLLKTFPRPMVYFMIILSMGTIAALAFLGLLTANIGLFIGMGVTFLVYALLLCCLWKKLNTGIALITIATKFIDQKKSVFFTPIIKLILTFTVGIFYVYSVSAMIAINNQKQQIGQDNSRQAGFIALFVLFWLVFMFVFYYMMTFTVSVACASWYYGTQGSKSSLLQAYKWMGKQFGSIVFAALVIAIVTFARMVVNQKRRENKNIAVAICLCLISCLLKSIQDLLRVLNHYTIIVLAITGQGYIDGAKSTMGLLWKQLGLMSITNLICNFLVLWGLIITIGIPCCLTYAIMSGSSYVPEQRASVVGIVGVCSMLVSTVVFEIIVQSVSCVFIYYSIDKSFIDRGLINAQRIPQQTTLIINRYSNNPYMMDSEPNQQPYFNNGGNNDYNKMRN